MYTYIGTYLTDLSRNHKEMIAYVSGDQLPHDGFAIQCNSILLPFVHELHRNAFLHLSDNYLSDTETDIENAYIDPEQPPLRTCIYGTPHLDNCLASKPISNNYFDIIDDEIDQWWIVPCLEEY